MGTNLPELKRKHDAYNTRLKARGVALLTYTVPCCGGQLEGRPASPGEVWDTLATCPLCGALYVKISTAEAIAALAPP